MMLSSGFVGSMTRESFWIDAISVNQKDLTERGSQVSLMVRIYSECALCTVWLGEDTDTTEKAFAILNLFASGKHFHEWPIYVTEQAPGSGAPGELEMFESKEGLLEPLRDVFDMPWWTRTWTVQEIILPRVAIVKCGRHEITWDNIMEGNKYAFTHLTQCCKDFSKHFGYQDENSVAAFLTAIADLRPSWEQYHDTVRTMDMIDILASHRFRQTSDLRDKVYGVLSFCPPSLQQTCLADYDASLPDCYSWPVIHDFQHSKSLRALAHTQLEGNDVSLPSWTPDWSRASDQVEQQRERFKFYNSYGACGTAALSYSRVGHALSLRGIHQETITHVGKVIGWFDETAIETIRTWHHLWQSVCGDHERLGISNDQAPPDIFMRTLLRGIFDPQKDTVSKGKRNRSYYRASEADIAACQRWWSLAQATQNTHKPHLWIEDKVEAARIQHVHDSLLQKLQFSRFFITDKQSIGLGPPWSMKVGDEVWIACGGKQPLILRRDDSLSQPDGQITAPRVYHKLVGADCYVDGIMHGEAAANLERDAMDVHII
ncbi:hypothetical protein VTL71DRAFT_14093 [Oculimacula yallundae]|uniref:Heterokaryon incompatibility domain-containing protein n=1 Tax=Oculimacula yallundae TaxID=86028 RepID=A0ABR4CHH4_9HELO